MYINNLCRICNFIFDQKKYLINFKDKMGPIHTEHTTNFPRCFLLRTELQYFFFINFYSNCNIFCGKYTNYFITRLWQPYYNTRLKCRGNNVMVINNCIQVIYVTLMYVKQITYTNSLSGKVTVWKLVAKFSYFFFRLERIYRKNKLLLFCCMHVKHDLQEGFNVDRFPFSFTKHFIQLISK